MRRPPRRPLRTGAPFLVTSTAPQGPRSAAASWASGARAHRRGRQGRSHRPCRARGRQGPAGEAAVSSEQLGASALSQAGRWGRRRPSRPVSGCSPPPGPGASVGSGGTPSAWLEGQVTGDGGFSETFSRPSPSTRPLLKPDGCLPGSQHGAPCHSLTCTLSQKPLRHQRKNPNTGYQGSPWQLIATPDFVRLPDFTCLTRISAGGRTWPIWIH